MKQRYECSNKRCCSIFENNIAGMLMYTCPRCGSKLVIERDEFCKDIFKKMNNIEFNASMYSYVLNN